MKPFHIYRRLYYKLLNRAILTTIPNSCEIFKETISLFIYFDYEREFSGHSTDINDSDIENILRVLSENGISATWFTVGKIFEKYPFSVNEIIARGHEIGSHSYGHISPFKSKKTALREDFRKFSIASEQFGRVSGYHSPNGEWAMQNFPLYRSFGFDYDLASVMAGRGGRVFLVRTFRKSLFIRLTTAGDDWKLYCSGFNQDNVFGYFVSYLEKLKPGDIAGIGFHPWILASDKNIFAGFAKFMEYIASRSDINTGTAISIVSNIKSCISAGR
jgi:peptidoglycan/xylan/chitin deacetylase (PgdA/CDA1 family)